MPKIRFKDTGRGLFLEGAQENMPEGSWRRFKGVKATSTNSIMSRNGSTSEENLADVHSLKRFNDILFQGATTVFYQSGVSRKTGLSGDRLTMIAMPPTVGKTDILYVSGGGDLFKINTSAVVNQWGIDAPADGSFTASAGVAGVLTGTYQYLVTFRNETDGTRSNANPTAQSVTLSAQKADLTNIPLSGDPQVTAREIWRTTAGGASFFLLHTILNNTVTSYEDNTADTALTGLELPLDNDPPADTYADCEGPHDGRMWWCRDSGTGKKGRVYYSAQGRPESVEGFLDVTNDDDPTQKGIAWNGRFYVFTQTGIHEIIGGGAESIFTASQVGNAIGTSQPFTVIKTNFGIIYQANDSIRLFDGVNSTSLGIEAIESIFRGETIAGIADFNGIVATFGADEYTVSDQVATLAYDFRRNRWREIGIGAKALHYDQETSKLFASFNDKVLILENENTSDDNGTAISFEIETPAVFSGSDFSAVLKRIIFDANLNGQVLFPVIVIDDTEITLPSVTNATRCIHELNIGRQGHKVSLRLTGSLMASVEIFEILFDVYLPQANIE